MKTRLDWPTWREPTDHEPVEVIYFSRFDDVTPLWSVLEQTEGGSE